MAPKLPFPASPQDPELSKLRRENARLKAQIVLEALREAKSVDLIASEYELHPNLVTKWKQEAVTQLPTVFERKSSQALAQEAQKQKSSLKEADLLS